MYFFQRPTSDSFDKSTVQLVAHIYIVRRRTHSGGRAVHSYLALSRFVVDVAARLKSMPRRADFLAVCKCAPFRAHFVQHTEVANLVFNFGEGFGATPKSIFWEVPKTILGRTPKTDLNTVFEKINTVLRAPQY